MHFWRARFDFDPQQYVAGIMEEDDPSVPQLIKTPAGPGRHFTLYLYDREKNHVCGPHGSLVASPCATTSAKCEGIVGTDLPCSCMDLRV